MEKTKVEAKPDTVPVRPNTLMRRPMEYKHPVGVNVYFHGVFGTDADSKEAGDIWIATFFDLNECEAYIMASKAFGQLINGVRLTAQQSSAPKLEVPDGVQKTDAAGDPGPGSTPGGGEG